ncbi:MAG: hypothetical protein KDC46_03790 [Thermoleophilia bacterium]|nr:hypothetical protein [Thermoleophilia bacterium]
MTSSVSAATTPVDYQRMERDAVRTHVTDVQPRLDSTRAAQKQLRTEWNTLVRDGELRQNRHDGLTFLLSAGTLVGGGAVVGAGIGGVAARSLGGAYTGLLGGAAIGMAAMLVMTVLEGIGGGGDQSLIGQLMIGKHPADDGSAARRTELSDKLNALSASERDLTSEIEHYQDIAPGQPWIRTTGETRTLQATVESALADYDHDHDGSIRIDDESQSPRNETIRNPLGGPVANERERSTSIGREYGIEASWDTDSNGLVDATEAANGYINDGFRAG